MYDTAWELFGGASCFRSFDMMHFHHLTCALWRSKEQHVRAIDENAN